MKEFAIVAVGYNRPKSMLRLLNSLKNAKYDEDITLIISIDNSGKRDVENIVKEFIWPHGEKIIKLYPERLGLRNHILKCGEFTKEYSNIIVLEDDIYVSPAFYKYVKQAVSYYGSDENIAGISLYNHLCNVNCNRPFQADADKSDIYFLQYAQSWGQVWSREKWNEFLGWYEKNKDIDLSSKDVPRTVSDWPNTSWLKYHIKYIIETNKYFVYPKVSLSTNFSDVGQHANISTSHYQVNLQTDIEKEYTFRDLDSGVKYDAFFEREYIAKSLDMKIDEICIDLYGEKKNKSNKKYWVTMEKSNFECIKSYGLKLRPHENNIIFGIDGNDIHLYNTNKEDNKKIKTEEKIGLMKTLYDIKSVGRIELKNLVLIYYREGIIRKLRSIFKFNK